MGYCVGGAVVLECEVVEYAPVVGCVCFVEDAYGDVLGVLECEV